MSNKKIINEISDQSDHTTNTHPLISVVIPFFNRKTLICRAIDSVLEQTYTNFELILVDDASTDDSNSVINQYYDKRISLIKRIQNGGAGAARNTGIRAAQGEYIGFLDSDDTWLPSKLEMQLSLLEEQPYDCPGVICDFAIIEKQSQRNLSPFNGSQTLLRQLEWGCAFSPGSTLLVRKHVFSDIGYIDESLKRLEDWEWLIRYAMKYNFACLNNSLSVIYRTSIPETRETIEACQTIFNAHKHIFLKHGFLNFLRFFSTIQIEKSAAHFRVKHSIYSILYLFSGILLYPTRNFIFYSNIFNRAFNLSSRLPDPIKLQNHAQSICYLSLEPERQGHASYTHVHEIINNLRLLDWNISLFSPRYADKPLPRAHQRMAQIFKTLVMAITVKKPNVYYMRWHFAAFPLSLWAKITSTPLAIEVNGPAEDLFIAWPWTAKAKPSFRWLMNIQLNWADALISVTNGLDAMCREIVKEDKHFAVIPNGANVDLFTPTAATSTKLFKNLKGHRYVIFFGTMAAWQGIYTVIESIESTNWPAGIHVVFAGDGKERPSIEKLAACYDHVHYLGRVPYRDLPPLIADSIGSLVCTENIDGRADTGLAPLKLFESLACAVPVITTEMPFQADIVRENNCGIVIPPNAPQSLAKAVNQLANDSTNCKQMGKRGRELVVQSHSWYARATDTHNILKTLIMKKK
jgi:glycosyltransferase involved in cell wall biosynthesis